jgi:eukaryotic-like serine/threonine-protein kinase
MVIHCPKCLRKLPESGSTVDAPAFCMFCGQKLRSTDSGTTKPVMPDPSDAFRYGGASGGETMAFTPASAGSDDSPNDTSLTEASADASGTTINSIAGFVFRRFLGAGGMGTVYEAEAEASGQRVAIKLLAARLATNPSSVERFRQEGRVASQIMHPRCVFVLRADTEAGRPYIIMELMPGQTLKDMVDQKGPLHFSSASDRILDVIDGLVEAHRLGVIHRDVKPSNCFLTEDDRVKIGDFGLSKSLTTEGEEEANGKQLTSSGTFLGTVMYASPEQIRGEPVSYDSDVYAVCGTLYYLLTGKAPFQHESLTASLAKAVSEPPPPIRDKFPSVPKELERVVVRGLDRDRTRRYQTLTELRDALVDLQIEKQKPARPRAIILAYLIDSLLLTIATLPLEVLRQTLTAESIFTPRNSMISADFAYNTLPTMLLTGLYFTLGEGLFATTIGKRLLRLRVYRLGEVGPPGLLYAGIRFVVFWGLWLVVYTAPEWGLESLGSAGVVIGGAFSVLGIAALCLQFRGTAKGWRGPHDYAAGTRVVQRPRPPHRPRLVSRFANPLDRLQPTSGPMLPIVGSFTISGKLCDLPDGGEVWSGDDRSLGRRILLRLLPPGVNDIEALDQATETQRPTRLRTIGHGAYGATTTTGNLERRAWMAYVAPAGAPLLDVVSKETPLKWIDARTVLEQLTDELITQTEAGEFQPACIEQVWVEPSGRLQLLDFPLPSGRRGTLKPENTCPADDASKGNHATPWPDCKPRSHRTRHASPRSCFTPTSLSTYHG